jgi:hypothetical protein
MSDLFTLADERMVRVPDHQTSIDAAKAILPCRTVLQQQIVTALLARGPMTDGELENLEQFSGYGPSTVRKRRSELLQDGRVVWTGKTRDRMKEWAAL